MYGPALPAALLLSLALLACGRDDDCGDDPECDRGTDTRVFAATGSPRLDVYPVQGPHNGGYDRNWNNFTCPPHPSSSPDNSDYIAGDHYGNDIFAPRGTPVVAGRGGTIVRAGYISVGGNRVTIRDGNGWYYYYAHLDTITRWSGTVTAGTQIGTLGNTGAEWTAPHLHFSIYPDDCYSCGGDPFPYLQAVDGTSCTGLCECDAGEVQTSGCGNCGTHTRRCGDNCRWGAWSDCTGQGPCSPGSEQLRDCCDCGSQTRTCRSDCEWGDWGACGGPDPAGGTQVCETGQCGPCADGRMRCVAGCLECVSLYTPVAELCDGIDNDCNCGVDDGYPEEMGDPPPAYAARLRDLSFAHVLSGGEESSVWAEFENVGTMTWPAGDVFLGALAPLDEGATSAFYAEGRWPAWDIAAALESDVPPGAVGVVLFTIRAPADAAGELIEAFQLMGPEGDLMPCPAPVLAIEVAVEGPGGSDDGSRDPDGGGAGHDLAGGCSCAVAR